MAASKAVEVRSQFRIARAGMEVKAAIKRFIRQSSPKTMKPDYGGPGFVAYAFVLAKRPYFLGMMTVASISISKSLRNSLLTCTAVLAGGAAVFKY